MTTWKRWIDAVSLPVLMVLLTAGWYGVRAFQMVYLTTDVGMSDLDASRIYGLTTVFTIVGYLLAAAASLAVGPLPTVAVGSLLCAFGAGSLGLAGEDTALLPVALASLGYGVAIPGLWGAAARHLGGSRSSLRHGLFVLLWVALNVGAAASPPLTGALRVSMGYPAVFAACGVLLVIAAVVAAAAWIAQWVVGRRAPEEEPGFRVEGRRALVAGGVLLLAFLPWTLVFQVYNQMYRTYYELGIEEGPLALSTIMQFNPLVVIGVGLLLAPLLVVFHATRVRVPALFVAGTGMVLMGIGATPLLFPQVYAMPPLLMLCLLVLSVGEILSGPLLLSLVVGPWSWRLATAAAALWLLITRGTLSVLGLLGGAGGESLGQASAWLGVLLCLVVGLAMAVAAWPLRSVMASPAMDQSSR